MERFNHQTIQAALTTRVFGRELVFRPRTGSTNDVTKELASEGAPEGTVVVADEQMAGRGRMERRWFAPPGTCLLCSILFRPDLAPAEANRLTMLCSMAAADAIEELADLPVSLKWPNDLIIRSHGAQETAFPWRKLAGILTETGFVGNQLDFVVVGIGVNVNVPSEMLPQLDPSATSIQAETEDEVNRTKLLATLLGEIETRYERLQAGESPRGEWASRLATLGKRVQVTTTDGVFTGMAKSVDEDGALLLRTADGTHHRLMVGDVTLAHPDPLF